MMKKKSHLLLVVSAVTLTLHLIGCVSSASISISISNNRSSIAIYAFGDSIFDTGNNNRINTICRADHPPYGKELPPATFFGRFSNGKLPADILIGEIGSKQMLEPYLYMTQAPRDTSRTGISYASSCSGLDDLTANEVGVLTMAQQLMNFDNSYQLIKEEIGDNETTRLLNKALFLVSGGTSDMLDNYYALPVRRLTHSLSAYHDFLLNNLATFLKQLYAKEARRVGVLGMPPVGCLPMDITTRAWFRKRECVSEHNSDAQQYNEKLQQFIQKFPSDMPDLRIAYVDIYTPMMDMINNPTKYGFEHTHEGCCGTGSWELGPLCTEQASVCTDVSKYLFWDAIHPTQAAYEILTKIVKEKTLSALLSP